MRSVTVAAFRDLSDRLLDDVSNPHTKAAYRTGIEGMLSWWQERGTEVLDAALVNAYLQSLVNRGFTPSTINQRLAAVRRLAGKAAEVGLLEICTAADLVRIPRVRRSIKKASRSLAAAESEALINCPLA